jgi:hypothetical protein
MNRNHHNNHYTTEQILQEWEHQGFINYKIYNILQKAIDAGMTVSLWTTPNLKDRDKTEFHYCVEGHNTLVPVKD